MAAIRTVLFALAFAAMFTGNASAAQLEPECNGQESFIHRAIFSDGRLWLLSDAGLLFSIADGEDNRTDVALPEPALDLWSQDGRPAIITCKRDGCAVWTLRKWIDGQWITTAKVSTEGDRLVAVGRDGDKVTLLTQLRVSAIVGDKQTTTSLSSPLPPRPIASTYIGPTSIFLGFNAGEWGGGMGRGSAANRPTNRRGLDDRAQCVGSTMR